MNMQKKRRKYLCRSYWVWHVRYAYHITAPEPTGLGALKSMQNALNDACIDPSDLDYINAHGTSTPLGDIIDSKQFIN